MNEETATQTSPIVEPEVMKQEQALSKPSAPVTVEDLALLPEEGGVLVVQNRHKIVETIRKASIALTSPSDWLLFRTKEGVVTAYLQDSGCKRIWQLWGIEITPVGDFETISLASDENGDYAIQCKADGRSRATGLFVEQVMGVRYSTEDFCKDLPAIQKKVRVCQAAIANRDGNIIRALTGLKNVAIEEIESVYKAQATGKNMANAAKGKGFGSSREGLQNTPTDIVPPICELCNKTMRFVAGTKDYEAYWKCADYVYDRDKRQANGHSRVKDAQYRQELAARQGAQHGN